MRLKNLLVEETKECPKVIVYDSDIISVESVNKEKSIFANLNKYMVSSAIKHRKPGIHVWRAKIIGETQQFIHLLDNTGRAWIDIGGIETDFKQYDYVEVEVIVRGQYIKARKMKKICS